MFKAGLQPFLVSFSCHKINKAMFIDNNLSKKSGKSFPYAFLALVLMVGGVAGFARILRAPVTSLEMEALKETVTNLPKEVEGLGTVFQTVYAENVLKSGLDDRGNGDSVDKKKEGSRKNKMEPKDGKKLVTVQNQKPLVSIDLSLEGKSFKYGETVTMAVNSSDSDGVIDQLNLVVNDIVVETVTVSSYAFELKSLPLGVYKIYAKALDDDGEEGISRTITIYVDPESVFDPDISESISKPISDLISIPLSTIISDDISTPVSTIISDVISMPISESISGVISDIVSTPLSNAVSDVVSSVISGDISQNVSEVVSNIISVDVSGVISSTISEIVSMPVSDLISKEVSQLLSR